MAGKVRRFDSGGQMPGPGPSASDIAQLFAATADLKPSAGFLADAEAELERRRRELMRQQSRGGAGTNTLDALARGGRVPARPKPAATRHVAPPRGGAGGKRR